MSFSRGIKSRTNQTIGSSTDSLFFVSQLFIVMWYVKLVLGFGVIFRRSMF